jgi:hypothetical protein
MIPLRFGSTAPFEEAGGHEGDMSAHGAAAQMRADRPLYSDDSISAAGLNAS